jgi:hypothetical protein
MTNTHRDGAGVWVWVADEEIGPVHAALDVRADALSRSPGVSRYAQEAAACQAVAGRLSEVLQAAGRR